MDVGLYKSGLDKLGEFVDSLFLTIPRILKPMKPVRDIDRNTYEKEVDFYIENGYADHPDRFFDFPDMMPGYQVIEEMPFDDRGVEWNLRNGIYRFQLVGYVGSQSEYSPPVIINVE